MSASVEDPSHLNRARAESFGAVAAEYDRFRPGYPDQLIDDLVALRPAAVLDIGCGTGKAARLLAARGVAVLGVEIDPAMAAVARSRGLDVEVASFEGWDDAGRRFDLIISAQAWHWVDPAVAAPKAAGLLHPGGTVALFWNYDEPEPGTARRIEDVYRALAPELISEHHNQPTRHLDALRATGAFSCVETHKYEWQTTMPADDWVGMVGTQSAHLQLGAQRLAAVKQALLRTLHEGGGTVPLTGGTYTIWARR